DCDRLAAEVVHKGEIIALTGNQTGVLMINYILSSMKEKNILPKNAAIVKSIVTGEMGTPITEAYGVKMFNVLTGFKNICALANEWDTTNEYTYILGYEESIGYNIGSHLRDKDAVSSTLILAEMAGYYKKLGKTLIDVLFELYEEYGYYRENTVSIVHEGIEGAKRIKRMMTGYRNLYTKSIGTSKLVKYIDYDNLEELDILTGKTTKVDMEETNAIEFKFDDGCWYTLRPSGTEPKIKLYVYTKADTLEVADNKIKEIQEHVIELLNKIQ
ncbi:MAG TPA: phospho-sugar mutase, partial [Clostridiales bacterium]|nr:phospho-sugar mutase [Clostridiales bacterium]